MVTRLNNRVAASWGTTGTPDYVPGSQIYGYDPAGALWRRALADATGALVVVDTGLHTNPRRYEKDNGFVSGPIAVVGPGATPVWAVGVAAVNPAAGRTAGRVTTVYGFLMSNNTGFAATVWLEIGGNPITAPYPIANLQVLLIDFPAGFNSGNADIDVNASVAGVVGQVIGTEV